MVQQLVPFQGPGGVITFLQPNNPLVAGGSNVPAGSPSGSGGQTSLLSTGGTAPEQGSASAAADAGGDPCQVFLDQAGALSAIDPRRAAYLAAYAACKVEHAGGAAAGAAGSAASGAAGAAVSPVSGPLGTIAGFFVKLWAVFSNAAYWKSVGLILGGGTLIVLGLVLYGRGGSPVNLTVVRGEAKRDEDAAEAEEETA